MTPDNEYEGGLRVIIGSLRAYPEKDLLTKQEKQRR